MDNYSVKLMSRALRDLDGIYDYIAHTLLEPGTALNLVGRIEDAILSLETMPYRLSLIHIFRALLRNLRDHRLHLLVHQATADASYIPQLLQCSG